MGSVPPPAWQQSQAQDYEAAESMLQHSRGARKTPSQPMSGYPPGDNRNYVQPLQMPQPPIEMPMPPYSQLNPSFASPPNATPSKAFNAVPNPNLPPQSNAPRLLDLSPPRPYSQDQEQTNSTSLHNSNQSSAVRNGQNASKLSSERSRPSSPAGSRGLNKYRHDVGIQKTSHAIDRQVDVKEEPESKPSWAFEKTKAGKERKRLPLACIACRRKKIRCSGAKPACKHCTRARMPCVYKITTRKAAPRTDYMAMLERRLKRMEERVIKIIPKEEAVEASAIPRAIVRPSNSNHAHAGKKRGIEEAFGARVEEWVKSKPHPHSYKSSKVEENTIFTDGAEHLPSKDIQEHLSEVFFDYVYGQAYYLMHRPSYMKRLHAGTLPPVINLAVCAVAARFSTHPQLKSEPEYLRGEEWAAPVREIVLKRYDEPSISILTVTIILGLHEFGTCQGGRSWMFAGMATRMAHALQLHRELDHDPLGRKNGTKSELSFTDREIRRRAMWACFAMDRFTASGTERPMFADEEDMKVQLPIDESKFILEIPGPTEDLAGQVYHSTTPDASQSLDPKTNMGVAAYMIRSIALWGRVIKYLNMGGKDNDPYPIWDVKSQFQDLRKQALQLKEGLPRSLCYNSENLQSHATSKLANQFVFLHVTLNQIVLALHRFAVPVNPGSRPPKDMPNDFFVEGVRICMDMATRNSDLLANALDYHVVAPFMGYCSFTSSIVHIWAYFSGRTSSKSTTMKHLWHNVRYLRAMKRYWGVLHFMAKNLKEIYEQHMEAAQTGKNKATKDDGAIFQFGDWFDKYPHGVARPGAEDGGPLKKRGSNDETNISHKTDLKQVEDFFDSLTPAGKTTQAKKPKKPPKASSQSNRRPSHPQAPPLQLENIQPSNKLPLHVPDTQPQMPPSLFAPSPQLYNHDPYPSPQDLDHMMQANPSLIHQLDRQLVYGAYAGNDPTASTSASALDALTNTSTSQGFTPVSGGMWDGSPPLDLSQQQMMMSAGGNEYFGDPNSTAWFMPFNLQPSGDGGFGGPGG